MKRFLAALFAAAATVTGLHSNDVVARDFVNQTTVVHTNFVERWITNTAEVHMQLNRFVTEYHTNWITRARTNVVDTFSTNIVLAYLTNHVHHVRTNYVNVFATNLTARFVTNHLLVDAVQTNFVQVYHTNLKTLHLTNWTTVVALKTNWITRPITNVVEIDMAAETPPAAAVEPKQALSEPLALQASRSLRSTPSNQVEVQLKVSWTHAPGAPLQVQQWRIERDDGSILCFGQDPEFKRVLPTGTYKVFVRAQRDAKSPFLAALGTLTVTQREVSVEQRPSRGSSSI